MRAAILVSLGLIVCLSTGCVWHEGGTETLTDDKVIQQIHQDDTKADVERVVGKPDSKFSLGANELWIYQYVESTEPYLGFNWGEQTNFVVTFNAEGKVQAAQRFENDY